MSKKEAKLLQVADEFDRIILKNINDDDIDLKTVIGVMAHRLGAIINRTDKKKEMWEVCQKVILTEISRKPT